MTRSIETFIEAGSTRTFASAVEWPGWARSGRDEATALANLAAFRDRYAAALSAANLRPPPAAATYDVVERIKGGSGTDYGVASMAPSADDRDLQGADLERWERMLAAAWAAFDRAVVGAVGAELRKGPRGGGRDLVKMGAHVVEAEQAYVGQLGVKSPALPSDPFMALPPLHEAAIEALRARARGELPDVGARGGKRWSPRYFVRRAAWHILDHAWEIEDRAT